MYTEVMVDLETLGSTPGSVIISIGAVFFGRGMPEAQWRNFEVPVISVASCEAAGLHQDAATVQWWAEQAAEARTVVDAAKVGGFHLAWALQELRDVFPLGAKLWGNGADFDNVLLSCAYAATGIEPPWKFYNNRCFRTMKNESTVAAPSFLGVKHNALADALHQTRWLQAIWAVQK